MEEKETSEKNSNDKDNIILKKTLGHNQIVFNNGILSVWNMPCILDPISSVVVNDYMNITSFGKKVSDLQFYLIKARAKVGMEFLHKQWGYKNIRQVLDFQIETTSLMGRGITKLIRFDEKNKTAIVKIEVNPYAEFYKKLFGFQKNPVDNFIRAGMSGLFSYAFNTDMLAIETECIAMGKPYCVIEIKEKSKWDVNDPNIAKQIPDDESEFKEDLEKLTVKSMQKF